MVAPLDGIRVVEVANWLAAPSATALMADMGADVIKVEPPGGDVFRGFNMRSIGYEFDFKANYPFELDNRGKRSITVDLTKPGASDVVRKLAESADIFLTNLTQARRAQFGLTVEDLETINQRLVYVSFSGYGTEGPEAERVGFDYAAFWARSGIMGLLGDPGSSPPLARGGQGDHTTALNILAGALAALRMRDQTGRGQVVDVTLLGTGVWTIGTDVSLAMHAGQQPPRHDRTRPANPIWNSYQCGDGKWVLLVMPAPDPYWPKFCDMVQRPEWITDSRYATLSSRMENTRELTPLIEEIFRTANFADWARRLDEAGLIWAPVAELPDVVKDQTLRQTGAIAKVVDPEIGDYETLATPFRVRNTDVRPRGPAPKPGEHTQQVLSEIGFDDDQMAEFAAASVFG